MHVLVPFCISNTENCYLNVIADQTDASFLYHFSSAVVKWNIFSIINGATQDSFNVFFL